ncbi:Dabb family protein [Paenibacillus hamazuiensis]|uniref:Dabb family protein n=1 Tax=Paenibacillus hamazuiensis TaxID=2936508 RepID=UPI002010573D|nr:Dabb family protein [Paenibacillus hamazuiensis]
MNKKYEHIVLLKLKPNVTIDEQEDAVKHAYAFKDAIPGIVGLSAGINVTDEAEHMQGYTLGIRVTFENRQACRDYIRHPLHQNFLQRVGPFVEGIAVMDYPFA